MKKTFFSLASILAMSLTIQAQEVEFEEYDLDNGLHVILHQDNTAPVVTTSVMYHVGGKDREDGRTGFAHFFEHMMFQGSEHVEDERAPRIIAEAGGQLNTGVMGHNSLE